MDDYNNNNGITETEGICTRKGQDSARGRDLSSAAAARPVQYEALAERPRPGPWL